jgi:superfamily II DNA helicase RecQ
VARASAFEATILTNRVLGWMSWMTLELLERHFGYKSFRPQQLEVIEHVLGATMPWS